VWDDYVRLVRFIIKKEYCHDVDSVGVGTENFDWLVPYLVHRCYASGPFELVEQQGRTPQTP